MPNSQENTWVYNKHACRSPSKAAKDNMSCASFQLPNLPVTMSGSMFLISTCSQKFSCCHVHADTLLSVAFTDLMSSSVSQHKPVSGIFTSACDASRLATAQLNRHSDAERLQHTMAGASVLILLLTRADSPARTEACLESLLASSPPLSKVPLLVLTTASDLHQGVQQWMTTLPGQAIAFMLILIA